MRMDHPAAVETFEGNDSMQQQQQLVRERLRRIKAAAELGLARSSRGRQWARALRRRALLPPKDAAAPRQQPAAVKKATSLEAAASRGDENGGDAGTGEEEEQEVAVDEKVAMLRQLVPGGEDMEVEGLLEETADYIAALKAQVGVMRALACVLSGAGLDALLPEDKADGRVVVDK